MPKLSAKLVKTVTEAEDPREGGFTIWPDGWYEMTLESVEEQDTQSGNLMWNIKLGDGIDPQTGDKMPGKQFDRLNVPIPKRPKNWLPRKMSEKGVDPENLTEAQEEERDKAWTNYQNLSNGRMKVFFRAFGYTPDSDTEEMVDEGARALVHVGITTQQQGRRAGQEVNEVLGYKPLSDVEADDDDDKDGDTDF